ELVGQLRAIFEGLREQAAGVEEDDRRMAIDLGEEVEQHAGFGAEARHQRDAAMEELVEVEGNDRLGVELAVTAIERSGLATRAALPCFGDRQGIKRRHRGPP